MENMASKISPPKADLKPHLVHLGKVEGENRGDNIMEGSDCLEIQDPLFWLRSDSRQDPEVLEYLQHENNYTTYKMFTDSKDKELFEHIKTDLKNLIKEDDESVKTSIGYQGKDHFYRYYTKTVEGKSHNIHYLELTHKETHQVTCHILLDENSYKNTDSNNRCDIENIQASHNHKYLLFGLDATGSEQFSIHMFNIEDLANHVAVDHTLPDIADSNFAISRDEKFIFYTMTDSVNRPNSLFIYNIDTRTSKKLVQEDNLIYSVDFSLSGDGVFLLVNIHSYKTNSVYYVDISSLNFALLEDSDLSPHLKLIQDKEKDDKYQVKKIGNYFVILTNKLGNTDFIPMYCKIGEDTSEKKWKNINNAKLELKLGKKENDYVYYADMYVSKEYVTYSIRHNGVTKLASIKFNSSNDNYPFSDSWTVMSPYEETGVLNIFSNNHDTDEIIVTYSSLTTPTVYMTYNINNKSQSILKTRQVPTYDRNAYVSSRVYATSHDGEKIPVSIVHKKELDISNGPHKLHLYGYGAYGYTVDSDFDKDIVPLLNRDYIYAIAHVRGGGFMGFKWYESGKMMNKMNTFLDFKAVAEYLVGNKYTTPRLMSCEGASAGGLIMGYCMTKLHYLFNAIIATVPFVDVIVTMCDPSIPLTTQEWEQWGNSNNKKSYEYMIKYSPYDNIENNINYPHFYVTGGLNDPRVGYWEPAKFVAKLRHAHNNATDKLQVLDMKMNDGHFSSSDRYQYITEIAKRHMFLVKSADS